MDKPLQITFHNLPHSDAVEHEVRERVGKLEQVSKQIISCRVVIDSPHRGPDKGKTYAVRIEANVRGSEIVVSREPVGDLQLAMNDAFETARRRLKDHAERQKRH